MRIFNTICSGMNMKNDGVLIGLIKPFLLEAVLLNPFLILPSPALEVYPPHMDR